MAQRYTRRRVADSQDERRAAAYHKAVASRAARRRRLAQEVDPDEESMTSKFLATEPAVNEDGREIAERGGEGEVSDDLAEPTMKGDSEAPVQDSVTARRARAARLRRMAQEAEEEPAGETPEEEPEKESKKCSGKRAYTRRRAAEDAPDANEDAQEIIEDEKKRDEDVLDKVSKAARLASALKQHGAATGDTMELAGKIAKAHTAGEIDYAMKCVASISRKRSASKQIPRNVTAKQRDGIAKLQTTTRRTASNQGTDASALFM